MDALRNYAETELAFIGYDHKCDGIDLSMKNCVLELIDVFSKQGHSGFSANECVTLFNKLARFEPLKPIMCTDDEWCEVFEISDETLFQNKRHSAIFKQGRFGRPYFIDAIVWIDESDCGFTGVVEGIRSRQFIKIPFTPKTFRIKVDSQERIIDREILEEALDYYDFHGSVLTEVINGR
jgi:hypothetical protein